MKTLEKRRNGSLSAFPNLLENFLTRDFFDPESMNQSISRWQSLPAVNIRETGDAFLIDVAAPGLKKEDFIIELDNNILNISSKKENETQEKNEDGYTRREFNYQSFYRSFTLPQKDINLEKINANYKDGMLSITLPKSEEVRQKPKRQIKIS